MKIHTGIDMVEISRISKLIDKSGDRFLTRHFTQTEIDYCRSRSTKHFAGLLACKEAAYKAMKLEWESGFNWKNIEIIHISGNRPEIILRNCYKNHFDSCNFCDIDLSITYSRDYATAIVTILQLQA